MKIYLRGIRASYRQRGNNRKRIINGREYCRTYVMEGAAGSTYSQYAYSFVKGGKTVYMTFTLRADGCYNYDIGPKTECETEQASFNIDTTVDRIVSTLKFN